MTRTASPEAHYRIISQSTVTDDDDEASEIVLAGGDGEDDEPLNTPTDPPAAVVDGRIRLVHFILGCAVLLPWNGECIVDAACRELKVRKT